MYQQCSLLVGVLSRCCHEGKIIRWVGGLFSTPVSGVAYQPPAPTVESAEPILRNNVLTSMRIPICFRRLYRLHFSTQPPITIIMKLTTIWSDGRVEALLITNSWSWRKSHPMSFRSVPSTRYGDGGFDQDGLECYKEGRYRWICAPRVVPVSRPRLAGAAGFLRLFPAHAVSIATILFFLGRRFRGKGGWIPRVNTELNGYSPREIYQWSYK